MDTLKITALLAAGAVVCIILYIVNPKLSRIIRKRRFAGSDEATGLDKGRLWYEDWAEKTEHKLRTCGLNKKSKNVMQERLVAICGGFIVGAIILNNLVAGFMLSAFGLFWMRDRLEQKIRQHRENLIEIAASSVQLMQSAWETYHNVLKVIETAIPQMPYPVDQAFSKLLQSHNLNRSPELALSEFKEKVDNKYLCFLAHILLTNLTAGGDIGPSMKRISLDLRREKQEILQLREETAGAAFTSTILFAIPPLTFLLYRFLKPEAAAMLTHNFAGQLVMDIVIVLCIMTWFRLKSINKIEV